MADDNDPFLPEEAPFEFIKAEKDEALKGQSWKELSAKITAGRTAARKRRLLPLLLAAAVGAVALYYVAVIGRQDSPELATVISGAGQRQLSLPDSSQITLNRFSNVRVNLDKWSDDRREIWLKGEAFFDIRKCKKNGAYTNFIVHTDKADIEVLGTSFNVMTDSSGFQVSLNTGKIKAHIGPDEVITLTPGQALIMLDGNISKKEVDVRLYCAWKDDRFHFNNTSLGEVLSLIKKNYKIKVRVGEEVSLERKKISGTICVRDSSELFTALQTILGLHIKQTKDSLIINK